MKQWSEIKQDFLDALQDKIGLREAQSQFKLFFESYTGKYNHTAIDLTLTVNLNEVSQIQKQIKELQAGKPIQYVLGTAWFGDLHLLVTPNVLIPRQETEELVEWIKKEEHSPDNILDVGTGSGAIALALGKYFPQSQITGIDVSSEAIKVAEQNKLRIGANNCNFFTENILDHPKSNEKFDLIVSNPPYISASFAPKMDHRVTAHEPHLALFVPDNEPLLFYKSIANFAQEHLKKGGKLYFEINEFFSENLIQLLKNIGFKSIRLKKDLNGNDRMVSCIWQ